MADQFKEKGNASFRLGKWQEAIDFYSKGITLKPTAKETATLYSNRSACQVQLHNFDLAILDGAFASRVDTTFSKGYLRQAEAFTRLHNFKKAIWAYESAISMAEDESTKTKYIAKREAVLLLENIVPFDENATHLESILARRTRVKALEEAGLYLDLTTTKGTVCLSSDSMQRACKVLNATEGKVIDDRIFDGLLECLQYDSTAFAMTDNSALNLTTYFSTVLEELNLTNVIGKNVDVDTVIEYFSEQVEKDGNWDGSRRRLRHLVAYFIIFSLASTNHDEPDSDISKIFCSYALEIIDQGREFWNFSESEIESTCGFVFTLTFRRIVLKALLAQAERSYVAKVTHKILTHGAKKVSKEEALVKSVAKTIIEECEATPISERSISHYNYPLSAAHRTLGFIARQQSSSRGSKHGSGLYYNVELATLAAKHFRQAATALPEDSQSLFSMLYEAIEAECRAGILTAGQLFARVADAERSIGDSQKWAGPPSRLFNSHNIVRGIRNDLRKGILDSISSDRAAGGGKFFKAQVVPNPTQLKQVLFNTMKPIPSVCRLDPLFNSGPENGTDLKYRNSQPGMIKLMDITETYYMYHDCEW